MKIEIDEKLNLKTFNSLHLQKIENRWYASDFVLNNVECIKSANIYGVGKTQVDAVMDLTKKLIEVSSNIEKTLKNIEEVAESLKE